MELYALITTGNHSEPPSYQRVVTFTAGGRPLLSHPLERDDHLVVAIGSKEELAETHTHYAKAHLRKRALDLLAESQEYPDEVICHDGDIEAACYLREKELARSEGPDFYLTERGKDHDPPEQVRPTPWDIQLRN